MCHNISIGEIVQESPWIFIVQLEENLSQNEVENFLSDLKRVERPILVNLKDKNGVEVNYLKFDSENDFERLEINPEIKINLTRLVDNFSTVEFLNFMIENEFKIENFENFDFGELIFEAIKAKCILCVRLINLINEKNI